MARNKTFCSLLVVTLLLLWLSFVAASERRTALVIGNAAYEIGRLVTPAKDANDMAAALRQLGFQVTLLRDADLRTMWEAIDTFSRQLRQGGVGLFYFAGHGLQVHGENFLVPVGARIEREQDVKYAALPVGRVLDAMEDSGNNLNIIILDACRNNPFARSFRSGQAGLAQVQAVTGSLIAYATAPGSVAADGTGNNGVYTSHLLENMRRPGVPVEQVFKNVRVGVMKETNGKQTPWESSSLTSNFSFVPSTASMPPVPNMPPVSAPPYAIINVFFATDRKRTATSQQSKMFGNNRGELTYGSCQVSIPRDHRMGEIESPSIRRLEFRKDPKKHVVLLTVRPQDKQQYFAEVKSHVQTSSGKKVLLFVHGYNMTFADAAQRTAQIAYDLGFDGVPVFYSWPSQGTLSGYVVDETNIEWTQANLKRFLEDVAVQTEAENIYLIAHSMGNRAITRAFGALVSEKPLLRQRFREIILTAPDIDADVFKRDIAPQLVGAPSAITLYASSEDKALLASKEFHGYPRAGEAGAELVLVPGIETIDATGVDTSFLSHSYYAETRSVLADIFYIVREGRRPDHRFGLLTIESKTGKYWKFKK